MVEAVLIEERDPAAASALIRWRDPVADLGLSRQRTLGRALLRGMLAFVTETAPEGWGISVAASGKPQARHSTGDLRGPFVSLSHSGGWIAAAVSATGPIGIDLELHRLRRNREGIASLAFGPAERERAMNGGHGEFYRIWTLREAIAKATGRGFENLVDRVDRAADGPMQGQWLQRLDDRDWQLSHIFCGAFSFATALLSESEPIQPTPSYALSRSPGPPRFWELSDSGCWNPLPGNCRREPEILRGDPAFLNQYFARTGDIQDV